MTEERFDAIIVGAVIEAGSDLGGTWYWNRYPGARVDSYIPNYELAVPQLWKDWTWTEKYPGQEELQAYFMYVGDKLNLQHCRFDTVVKQAQWDNQLHLWHVTAEGKEGFIKTSGRYLILCIGFAAKPYIPNFKGRDTFRGPCCHTSRWPKEGIETTGKRVGVVGTGASGVQIIQELGPQVAHLTVFQRTPNLALPMGQYSVSKHVQDHFKPVYEELFKKWHTTYCGLPQEPILRPLLSDSEEEREANFERLWDLGGFNFFVNNYQDAFIDKACSEVAYAFWRKKVCERVQDPEKRALLAPEVAPHPFGTKRASLEQCFYEVFNQENVDLVDVKTTPIVEIYETGIKTTDKEYEFDVLIFATGFDSFIDLRGLNGETVQDHWKDGVRTYLGMTIDNFPNLFIMYGPQAPSAFSNGPSCLEVQGSWIDQTVAYLREHHITKFTPTDYAASTFKKYVDELWYATLLPEAPDSWYMGGNIPGKKREAYGYVGGIAAYKQEIMAEIDHGYPGFLREALK